MGGRPGLLPPGRLGRLPAPGRSGRPGRSPTPGFPGRPGRSPAPGFTGRPGRSPAPGFPGRSGRAPPPGFSGRPGRLPAPGPGGFGRSPFCGSLAGLGFFGLVGRVEGRVGLLGRIPAVGRALFFLRAPEGRPTLPLDGRAAFGVARPRDAPRKLRPPPPRIPPPIRPRASAWLIPPASKIREGSGTRGSANSAKRIIQRSFFILVGSLL